MPRAVGAASADGSVDRRNSPRTRSFERRGVDALVSRAQAAARDVRRRHELGSARMIDCSDYRRSILADPRDPDPRLSEHRAACRDCSAFTEGVSNFESRLDRALRVPLPPDRAVPLRAKSPPPARRPSGYRRGWLAMAASVVLALVVAGALWLAAPGPSLAADVVTHMQGEPGAWRTTDPVPSAELQDVLRDSRLQLTAGAGVV